MVLVIELENALAHMHTTVEPSKMWSPYREPLAKFLNKYTVEVLLTLFWTLPSSDLLCIPLLSCNGKILASAAHPDAVLRMIAAE